MTRPTRPGGNARCSWVFFSRSKTRAACLNSSGLAPVAMISAIVGSSSGCTSARTSSRLSSDMPSSLAGCSFGQEAGVVAQLFYRHIDLDHQLVLRGRDRVGEVL